MITPGTTAYLPPAKFLYAEPNITKKDTAKKDRNIIVKI